MSPPDSAGRRVGDGSTAAGGAWLTGGGGGDLRSARSSGRGGSGGGGALPSARSSRRVGNGGDDSGLPTGDGENPQPSPSLVAA